MNKQSQQEEKSVQKEFVSEFSSNEDYKKYIADMQIIFGNSGSILKTTDRKNRLWTQLNKL